MYALLRSHRLCYLDRTQWYGLSVLDLDLPGITLEREP